MEAGYHLCRKYTSLGKPMQPYNQSRKIDNLNLVKIWIRIIYELDVRRN